MQWSSDRTGFPVVELPKEKLAVQLLPVSKLQFERFLAEPVLDTTQSPALYGDAWYESLLAVLPRLQLKDAQPAAYEALFLGGVLPGEVDRFARWLGTGYDLPRADVWRRIDAVLSDELLSEADLDALKSDERLAKPARAVLAWLIDNRQPRTWAELGLFHGGLLEWVRFGTKHTGGLGRPRPEFRNILLNPQRDDPVKPIHNRRYAYFGFRLVRPL